MSERLIELEKEALKMQSSGDLQTAIKLYKEIIKEDPGYEFGICFYNLACCQEDIGELGAAEENYLKSIEYDNEDVVRLGGYASFLYLHGKPKAAFAAYLKLLKLEKTMGLDITETLTGLFELGKKIGLTKKDISL